jgi:predicted RNA-binding protein with PIN domain
MGVRWVVDAMNVIGSRPDGWWNDPDKAMRNFAATLDDFAAGEGDVTVVFDRAPADLPHTRLVRVMTASRRGRNAADYEIEQLVESDRDPASIRVVTSDRRLADRITELGASVLSSGRFRALLDQIVTED